jgi:acyl-CoA synthetase (NDP forming)
MTGRLGDGDYVLEQMDRTPDGVELIVGARRDPAFGPVVLVGLGGVEAELYRDVRLALAPVSTTEARRMLGELRAFPLLQGWRGKPPVDLEAAAAAVVAVSRLVAETPEVSECEVNPLRVTPHGAVALDALVVAAVPPTTSPTGAPE